MKANSTARNQRGYVLITAIIFLVLLTIVALVALKNSGLEARMGANNTLHAQAFESAETSRRMLNILVDTNVFNRGWPATAANGTVNDSEFDATSLSLFTKPASACGTSATPTNYGVCLYPLGGTPSSWYTINSECSGAFPCASFPMSLDVDAQYKVPMSSIGVGTSSSSSGGSSSSSGSSAYPSIIGTIAVYKLNASLAPGSGAQMNAGYLGVGHGTAANGSYLYFFINGHGQDFGNTAQAGADTSTVFRDVIRN
jgi:Tfp pilus assembly protein PilX